MTTQKTELPWMSLVDTATGWGLPGSDGIPGYFIPEDEARRLHNIDRLWKSLSADNTEAQASNYIALQEALRVAAEALEKYKNLIVSCGQPANENEAPMWSYEAGEDSNADGIR